MHDASPVDYEFAYEELARLKSLELELAHRRELLSRLAVSAPAWASAIENRWHSTLSHIHRETLAPLGNGGSFTTS